MSAVGSRVSMVLPSFQQSIFQKIRHEGVLLDLFRFHYGSLTDCLEPGEGTDFNSLMFFH